MLVTVCPTSSRHTAVNIHTLENPLYYRNNFQHVLDWVAARYDDMLDLAERRFIADFSELPQASQALLVRMVMRKGTLFRSAKLNYPEIGDIALAAAPLCALGWVNPQPALHLAELFGLLGKPELLACLPAPASKTAARKREWLEQLTPLLPAPRTLAEWAPQLEEQAYALTVMELCDRLRLMFFGNLAQDWSEFVLVELGHSRYEQVGFSRDSRALRERVDIDVYLRLHACRERFEQGVELLELFNEIATIETANPWLQGRRAKLLFQLGQHAERMQQFDVALAIYPHCPHPGARVRRLRVLERCGEHALALELHQRICADRPSPAERQHLPRILTRLQRRLGLPVLRQPARPKPQRIDLSVPYTEGWRVEYLALEALTHAETPVYYVENTLINSLFGLLCWPAIFAPLPGAFFHAYHSGPADLLHADFAERRAALFAECFALLHGTEYRERIRATYRTKAGLQSPFVSWANLDEPLLELALACIPAEHLRLWFERLLLDIKSNRAGMPDLIQFHPAEARYQMIEIKGPGDRLQYNQLRWLEFCLEHGMPVAVAHVSWAEEPVEELAG